MSDTNVLSALENDNVDLMADESKAAKAAAGGTAFQVTMTGVSANGGAAAAAAKPAASSSSAPAGGSFAASAAAAAAKRSVRKGRGHTERDEKDKRYEGKSGMFESLKEGEEAAAAQQSIEGWIVFATNVHEEAQEDDVYELFADYGEIKQIVMNLDRRTGFVKGYAMIEYEKYSEAAAAIEKLNGAELHEQKLSVDWAFKKPIKGGSRGAYRPSGGRGGGRGGARRARD